MNRSDHDDQDRQDRLWLSLIAAGGRDAEKDLREVVQDVFMKIWKSAGTFRDDAKPSSWIHSIARNAQFSVARRRYIEDTLDDGAWAIVEGEHPAACGVQAQARRSAADALQNCDDEAYARCSAQFPLCAQALTKVVQEDWPNRDVAAMLQRTEGATREFMSQGRQKLKHLLEPCAQWLRELA